MSRAALLALVLFACGRPAHPRTDIPYIENDLSRALAEGKRTHRPVIVDVWASWCEPCKEMAATLEDPAVTSLRDRFVWASLDRDDEANAAALARYPITGLPTLSVIDPESERVVFTTHSATKGVALRRVLIASEEVARGTDWEEKAVAARWVTALEREPATTFEERVVVADRLVPAYHALGRPERAIPLCESLEREAPTNAGPPFTLARAYLEAGRIDDARAAAERARRLAPPEGMTFSLYALRADIEEKAGAHDALIAILAEAVETARRLERERPGKGLAEIRAHLEARLSEARGRSGR